MQLKVNKELYDKWTDIGQRILGQRDIVRYTIQVHQNVVADWLGDSRSLQNELQSLVDETIKHCGGGETYTILYRGEVMAEIMDFDRGFMAAIEDMNAELDVVKKGS